ncbi:nucleoside deaminase [Pseudazoarcus pumilus]|uniref:tRNA-specific adenosine deaminase n=1 Tax=Pseudazoarcus pumilus TaxID=2067960 RepID=A0A2I6S3D7_9RHOO|nr:nucleoside deaminase [Pseudazoarcus pumilus]AUN93773.1 tRNA-specific adenosine deaminase [Pseudazoarcus pumilus]
MRFALTLPEWLDALDAPPQGFASDEDAMRFAIDAAARNIDDGGGPFGALVLDARNRLVAIGVNRVIAAHASCLHAEMVALLRAQQRLGTHDLATCGPHTLVSTCAPCAMCLGAIPFSGVRTLVCGADGADAEAIGFDEGAKPPDWVASLVERGIEVRRDCLADEARALLLRYRDTGGRIY